MHLFVWVGSTKTEVARQVLVVLPVGEMRHQVVGYDNAGYVPVVVGNSGRVARPHCVRGLPATQIWQNVSLSRSKLTEGDGCDECESRGHISADRNA